MLYSQAVSLPNCSRYPEASYDLHLSNCVEMKKIQQYSIRQIGFGHSLKQLGLLQLIKRTLMKTDVV